MLKDVTNIYSGQIIHTILHAAESAFLASAPVYCCYHKIIYDGETFFVSLNTRKVYKVYDMVSINDF